MKILKFLIADFLYILIMSFVFLFNPGGAPKANLLLTVSIGRIGFYFELVMITLYIISSAINKYHKGTHTLLFSLFGVYINIVAIQFMMNNEMIDLKFYVMIFILSVLVTIGYYKFLTSIESKEQ